jgi:hypothetical protein
MIPMGRFPSFCFLYGHRQDGTRLPRNRRFTPAHGRRLPDRRTHRAGPRAGSVRSPKVFYPERIRRVPAAFLLASAGYG